MPTAIQITANMQNQSENTRQYHDVPPILRENTRQVVNVPLINIEITYYYKVN
jgi:hypothetical protein